MQVTVRNLHCQIELSVKRVCVGIFQLYNISTPGFVGSRNDIQLREGKNGHLAKCAFCVFRRQKWCGNALYGKFLSGIMKCIRIEEFEVEHWAQLMLIVKQKGVAHLARDRVND